MRDDIATAIARLTPGLVEDLLWVDLYDRAGGRRRLCSGRGAYKIDGARELVELGLVDRARDGLSLTGLGCDVVRALRAADAALTTLRETFGAAAFGALVQAAAATGNPWFTRRIA